MSTTMAYCPHCQQNVLTAREDIDVFLAIILLIFTGGVGLLIYVVIYYKKEPNHCVHCNIVCEQPQLTEKQSNSNDLLPNHSHQGQNQKTVWKQTVEDKAIFCPNCGVKFGERENIVYCALCGGKVE